MSERSEINRAEVQKDDDQLPDINPQFVKNILDNSDIDYYLSLKVAVSSAIDDSKKSSFGEEIYADALEKGIDLKKVEEFYYPGQYPLVEKNQYISTGESFDVTHQVYEIKSDADANFYYYSNSQIFVNFSDKIHCGKEFFKFKVLDKNRIISSENQKLILKEKQVYNRWQNAGVMEKNLRIGRPRADENVEFSVTPNLDYLIRDLEHKIIFGEHLGNGEYKEERVGNFRGGLSHMALLPGKRIVVERSPVRAVSIFSKKAEEWEEYQIRLDKILGVDGTQHLTPLKDGRIAALIDNSIHFFKMKEGEYILSDEKLQYDCPIEDDRLAKFQYFDNGYILTNSGSFVTIWQKKDDSYVEKFKLSVTDIYPESVDYDKNSDSTAGPSHISSAHLLNDGRLIVAISKPMYFNKLFILDENEIQT